MGLRMVKQILHSVWIQILFVGCLLLLNEISLVASNDDMNGDGTVLDNTNGTQNSNSTKEDEEKSTANTGAVVAAVVIAVVACIAVVVILYVIKRKRQSRMMDKEKKMQIQMSSARNAGVYQDLTVSVPTDEKPPASPEHERLHTEEA